MQIELNGEYADVADKITVAELLADMGIENRYCAVELNRDLVPREDHAERRLEPGDRVEVVTLVGGG